jgi:DinB superfamily
MGGDWNTRLFEQLDWHWQRHLRPRLDGLTDEEYFWEPVGGCWSIRRRSEGAKTYGSGEFTIDYERPEPKPPPVTTIAWRLAHLIIAIFGMRAASHFGGSPVSYETFPYAGSADEALHQLDEAYGRWSEGVRGLDDEGWERPVGRAEGPFAESPMVDLVLHINRETIHHGAEILLLRDLYESR